MTDTDKALHDEVRRYYAAAEHAAAAGQPACCDCDSPAFGSSQYDDLGGLPDAAVLASIGCDNPTAVADLRTGDTVLDLGSGGGIKRAERDHLSDASPEHSPSANTNAAYEPPASKVSPTRSPTLSATAP